jgi:hypothetical protein
MPDSLVYMPGDKINLSAFYFDQFSKMPLKVTNNATLSLKSESKTIFVYQQSIANASSVLFTGLEVPKDL